MGDNGGRVGSSFTNDTLYAAKGGLTDTDIMFKYLRRFRRDGYIHSRCVYTIRL